MQLIVRKKNKQIANRKFRKLTKQNVQQGDEGLPEVREVSNVWTFDKDEKIYYKNMTEKDLRK
ncbi:hypothetical protein SAMN05444274_11155 [Mariniphaga anaerophila]|uniref:Uncharacterized protein n=1 Tax=Mariniphaga anaerophila TaxID=1484053 RepID=A0A1M5F7W7_9BACT|nr:hypothetical protein [Mariniphaga anaerophila]SHF87597.1 hypothetical protein SAMN05444274_11155 [Mariniphaga anaerophila]